MRWNYDDTWRDKFETCEHRDILIVPHGTNVVPVLGGPPKVTSKIPVLDNNDQPVSPAKYRDVEFIITNEDIYKEKFEYTNSLDTNEDLAFTGCESAMVKFTIRNNKTYNEITGVWETDIPNLQTYVITGEQRGDSTLPTLVGEVQTHYIIKVYMYFNGDSSSLLYLGMFVVEEDKVSGDGYTRDITALDFLYTFRELDIHNWYVHLFRGINYLSNDYKDYFKGITVARKPSGITDAEWKEGWIRKPKDKWTIGEMLQDLITNIATRYPSEKTVTNQEKNKVADADGNLTNYYTNDEEPYTGMAMPIILDPDLFDYTKEYSIPTETGSNKYECYGYMPILELPVYEDPKIMDAGSLSAGKFLEDIGALAGRYPYIRTDDSDLRNYNYSTLSKSHPYNLYEVCTLTFKPLQSKDDKIVSNNKFDNSDIAKGFKHDYYTVDTIHTIEYYTRFDEKEEPSVKYENLTRAQRQLKKDCPDLIKKVSFTSNMFIDYLAKKVDDIKYAKDNDNPRDKNVILAEYAEVIEILTKGKAGYNRKTDGTYNETDPLIHPAYKLMKYRTYTPYELTTFADPVRDVGDRIEINFENKVTGEQINFPTYILSRKISGIQKMMDTYVAKGNVSSYNFSNYKTGASYQQQSLGYYSGGSGSSSTTAGGTTFTGITKDDFAEIIRNIGFRLLDEPTSVVARFIAASTSESNDNVQVYSNSGGSLEPEESSVHNGDTTNPIIVYDNGMDPPELQTITVNVGDYYYLPRYGDGVEYSSSLEYPYYVWTGSKWIYAGTSPDNSGGANIYWCGSGMYIEEFENGEITENSSCNSLTLKLNPESARQGFSKSQVDNTQFYIYGYTDGSETSLTVTPKYGDVIKTRQEDYAWYYQYPGFWTENYYPNMDPITINVPPHVELKWSDPDNISTWEPKPCAWEGTVIIRKRNAAPLHRWDGELIVDSTTKDAYKNTAFIDDTIELNRTYYYGFFPYYTAYTEDGHPIKYYRFTKTVRVSTGVALDAPEILSIERIS